MTTTIDDVEDLTPRVQYTAGTNQAVFPYPFPIFSDSDLVVYVDSNLYALNSQYTVSGAGNDTGGNVTFTPALAGTQVVTIYRDLPIERSTDFQQNGKWTADAINNELDRITLVQQQLASQIGRAIRFPQIGISTDAQNELNPISNWFGKILSISSTGILQATDIISGLVTLTQDVIGRLLNPQTSTEAAVGITPTNYRHKEMHVLRYGNNTVPGTTDMSTAVHRATSVAQASVNTRVVVFDPGTYYIPSGSISGTLQSIKFESHGAFVTSDQNAPVFDVSACDDCWWDGFHFTGNAGNGVSSLQVGLNWQNSSRCRATNNHFENLAVGVQNVNSLTGLLTAAVQIPSEISGNTIKNCFQGIFLQDDGSSHFGEYVRIINNTINDCQNIGINDKAGNTAIIGNTITGNVIGVIVSGAGTTNGDHGLIVGNTINHNKKANLYIHDTLRCQIVTGNNFWASLGDGTTGGNLGTSNLASSFGVYLDTCSSIIFTNNVVGRNKVNLGTNALQYCVIANNEFLTDPTNTVSQWVESTTYGSPNFNSYGPNKFTGTFTGGGNVGDPTGDFSPVYTNSWADFGSTFAPVRYWKDSENVVHLSGLMKSGTVTASAFTLPATMRPADGTRTFATASNSLFGALQVNTDGTVVPTVGSNVWFSLDGVSFRAGAVAK